MWPAASLKRKVLDCNLVDCPSLPLAERAADVNTSGDWPLEVEPGRLLTAGGRSVSARILPIAVRPGGGRLLPKRQQPFGISRGNASSCPQSGQAGQHNGHGKCSPKVLASTENIGGLMVGGTVTRSQLARVVRRQTGLDRDWSAMFVALVIGEIASALVQGEYVKIPLFGRFYLRDKGQRPGRNPKTGEETPISARRVVVFRASRRLKDQVAGSNTSVG
jgi:integration host factor subunit alpha